MGHHAGAEDRVRNEEDQLPVLQRMSLNSDSGEVPNKCCCLGIKSCPALCSLSGSSVLPINR